MSYEEDTRQYVVLKNEEGEYSLWLSHKQVPAGWSVVGKSGSKEDCSRYVDEVWTDMRPRTLIEASGQ